MTFDDYQIAASRTMSPSNLAVFALGVAGEAGEVADLVKKHLGHGKNMHEHNQIEKEIGDVLWYLAALCQDQGLSLSDCARGNIDKLLKRYPDGFSHAASAARVDVKP